MIPEPIKVFTLPIDKLVFSSRIQDLCKAFYPGHKHGCPNYGKKEHCPPTAKLINEIIDITKPLYLVWEEFDLQSHIIRMKEKHPELSDRQRNLI